MTNSVLSDMAASLKEGDALRGVCPFCNGGSTRERSFSIRRQGAYGHFFCFRASCNASGRIGYGGVIEKTPPSQLTSVVERYSGALSPMSVSYFEFFKERFNIIPELMREYTVRITEDGRVWIPILAPTGKVRGEVLRYYPELSNAATGFPKAKMFLPRDETGLSWHRITRNNLPNFFDNTLVVVEDQVSAIKASRITDAVALLGTNLNIDKLTELAQELKKHGNIYDTIVLLLDSDAWKEAIKHTARSKSLLPGLCTRKLERDVKDMTYTELNFLLREVNNHVKET